MKTASLTLNDPTGQRSCFWDQDGSLIWEHFSFLPNSSPQLTFPHFIQLHLHVSGLLCLVLYLSHSKVFLYILPSYFLHSSQAFTALFLLSLLVSYSFTIISIPSCCIYQKGYGALRIFFFFFHTRLQIYCYFQSAVCGLQVIFHKTPLAFWRVDVPNSESELQYL